MGAYICMCMDMQLNANEIITLFPGTNIIQNTNISRYVTEQSRRKKNPNIPNSFWVLSEALTESKDVT